MHNHALRLKNSYILPTVISVTFMGITSSDYFPIGIKRLVFFFFYMERVGWAIRGHHIRKFQSWKGQLTTPLSPAMVQGTLFWSWDRFCSQDTSRHLCNQSLQVQLKPLIMITLGLALFDNIKRRIQKFALFNSIYCYSTTFYMHKKQQNLFIKLM
jgi:EamA domain-containing membrane protein RarD